MPPYALAFDAYGSTNLQLYHDMGKEFAGLIAGFINQYVDTEDKTLAILEWRCGPGRIIRHLQECIHEYPLELYGSGYNPTTITWCRKKLTDISFYENQLSPPLPFGPNFFDCVYVFSVFTHLSHAMQLAWSHELNRVLKPKGILIFTTHGDFFTRHLTASEKKQYQSGEPVIRERVKEGTRGFAAWHPPAFVTSQLLRGF